MKLWCDWLHDAVKGVVTVIGLQAQMPELMRHICHELRSIPRRRTRLTDLFPGAQDP